MLMSRLFFLLKHSRKINLFCSLVKRTLKPHPSGEVAASADGEGCLWYLLFQVLKKKQKGTGDYYRDCVPDPATLFSLCEA